MKKTIETPKDTSQDKDVENFIQAINKEYKGNLIYSPNSANHEKMPRISTGSLALDLETGGGFPKNRISEVYGPESSGKSFIMYKTIAKLTQKKEYVFLLDEEGSFDEFWAIACGIDLNYLKIGRAEYGEQSLDLFETALNSKNFSLACIDSINALLPKTELEASFEESQMALLARLMGKATRKITKSLDRLKGSKNESGVIVINQLRNRIGSYMGGTFTPGGEALKYYSSLRMEIKKVGGNDGVLRDDKENVYGQNTKFVTVKNKTYPPMRSGVFTFFLDGVNMAEFDNYSALVEYGTLSGKIIKNGAWYEQNDWVTEKTQGAVKLNQLFRTYSADRLRQLTKELSIERLGYDMQFDFNVISNEDFIGSKAKHKKEVMEEDFIY